MPRSSPLQSFCRLAFVASFAAAAGPIYAASWNTLAGGDWGTAANWSGGIPSSGSSATIANGAAVGIGSSASAAACASLTVSSGSLTMGTGSTGLRVSSTSSVGEFNGKTGHVFVNGSGSSTVVWNAGSLMIGGAGTGAVEIQGARIQSTSLRMGLQANSSGTLTVSGPRVPYATFQSQGPSSIGESGFGSMAVVNGGQFTQSYEFLRVGAYAKGFGSVLIDGANSEFKAEQVQVTVGEAGPATFTVRNAGSATMGQLFIGKFVDSRGQVDVSGAQSVLAATDVRIGPEGFGSLNVTAGGLLRGSQIVIGAANGRGALLVSGAGSWAALGTVEIRNGAFTIEKGAGTDAGIKLSSSAAILSIGDSVKFNSNVFGGGPGTINFTNAQEQEFVGSIEGPHVINVLGGGVVRFSASTLDFSSGPVNVTRGTLVADFTHLQKAVVVGPDGVLIGPGGIGANVFVQGVVSPGDPAMVEASSVFQAQDLSFAAASVYRCEVTQSGVAKDRLEVGRKLMFSANQSLPARIQLVTLGADGLPGALPDFDSAKPCTWTVATAEGGIFGFDRESVVVDLTAFQNSYEGSFDVTENGSDLEVLYLPPATPTPTPSPRPPTKPPVITVDGKGTVTSAKAICVLSGDVRSASAHVRVECRIGTGAYRRVSTSFHWRTRVSLRPGRNVVSFRAFDAEGRGSNVEKVVIVFKND